MKFTIVRAQRTSLGRATISAFETWIPIKKVLQFLHERPPLMLENRS